MKFIETIKGFLTTISDSSYDSYKRKIDVFYNFISVEKKIDDDSYQLYLKHMGVDEIIESLDFYINTQHINSQAIAWHFCSVVKNYICYLDEIGIKNDKLIKRFGLPNKNIKSFQYLINNKILNDNRLEKRDPKAELLLPEVKDLIAECDREFVEIQEKYNTSYLEKNVYDDLVGLIIITLILYTGVPYRIIRSLTLKSLNLKYNTICINGITVHLPNNLYDYFQYYSSIRDYINGNLIKSDFLFVRYDGKKLGKDTNIVANTLVKYIDHHDITCIIKYAIIQMISKGVNQSIIQKFTDSGTNIYNYCQQIVNDQKTDLEKSRYLDSKLRSIETFDLL